VCSELGYRVLYVDNTDLWTETWTAGMEETYVLRINERETVRKIYGPVREGERWKIRTNKEIKDYYKGHIM
jgi:hypothetical protein